MDHLHTLAIVGLYVCLGVVAYSYVGYPLLLLLLVRLFGRGAQPPGERGGDEHLPFVSLLIAAYNEEQVIEARVKDALSTDYPADRFEIVIGSDGSSDRTAEIVRSFSDARVRLLDFEERRGKPAVLNSAMEEVRGDIVILSDANTFTDRAAVRNLTRWFSDPAVGVVCGKLVLTDPQTGRNVDSAYWKYETMLKLNEGRLDALLGSNGAIYAIRKALFVPIPPDTIVDDFVIPLLAKIRTSCKIVYDREALAFEETAPDVGGEFHRRARIGAGGFQSICMLGQLLNPRRGWVSLTFFSHKVLRWLCPFCLLGALFFNSLLVRYVGYQMLLTAQACFYAISVLGLFAPASFRLPKLVRLAAMFTAMNAALLVGFWRWASRRQRGMWRRTARSASTRAPA